LLFVVSLDDALNFILLIMQILDLSNVIFLSIVKNLQKIMWLISNGEVLSLFRLKSVFSKKHWIIICLPHIGLPVSLDIVKGVYEILKCFEVVEHLGIF
jgi:hypothetical protein